MQVSVCLFLCLVGVAWCQLPKPCTPPSQFRTRLSQYDHGHDVIRRYNMTYDEINKRKYIVEEERNFMPGRQFFTFIVLTQQNVLYTINHQTHTCTKTPNPTWRSIAIAPNSTFEDAVSFGGPGEIVYATQWSDRVPLKQRESFLVEFTASRCYPLRAVLITRGDVTSTISEDFYDYQAGIPNPSVFTPPAECNTAKWEPPPKHFVGF